MRTSSLLIRDSLFGMSKELLLDRYRELDLADVSQDQRLILKGRGRLLVDAIAAELC